MQHVNQRPKISTTGDLVRAMNLQGVFFLSFSSLLKGLFACSWCILFVYVCPSCLDLQNVLFSEEKKLVCIPLQPQH